MTEHASSCDGAVHWHVRYDLLASGFRATIRCACRLVDKTGAKVHESCRLAEEEGKLMVIAHGTVKPKYVRPRTSRVMVRR